MRNLLLATFVGVMSGVGCNTLPTVEHPDQEVPKQTYSGDPDRPFQIVGTVKVKQNFGLNPDDDEDVVCRKYFNHAVTKLWEQGQKNYRADAVIRVKSVVYLLTGKMETYDTPECAIDGGEGQVLVAGTAVRWKLPPPVPSPSPSPSGQSVTRRPKI